jgi:hypothetical protein
LISSQELANDSSNTPKINNESLQLPFDTNDEDINTQPLEKEITYDFPYEPITMKNIPPKTFWTNIDNSKLDQNTKIEQHKTTRGMTL